VSNNDQRSEEENITAKAAVEDERASTVSPIGIRPARSRGDTTSMTISKLEKKILELESKIDSIALYAEKSLHQICETYDLLGARTARPFYPLDGTWGLTSLRAGQPFFVNTEDRNITPWIIMGGLWETNVDTVLTAYAQPGMNILDIGANMGYYTVRLGERLAGRGVLHAFEPNPEVSDVCVENIKINSLGNFVKLHKIALGAENGSATLTRSKSNMASANLLGDQDADVSFEVPVRRLDDVLPVEMSIDLIKLDAEGFEKNILDGGASVLERSPKAALMIEVGLERWERSATIGDLGNIAGDQRSIYAVNNEGHLIPMEVSAIREFLLTCAFHENYFFIAPQELVETFAGHLVKQP